LRQRKPDHRDTRIVTPVRRTSVALHITSVIVVETQSLKEVQRRRQRGGVDVSCRETGRHRRLEYPAVIRRHHLHAEVVAERLSRHRTLHDHASFDFDAVPDLPKDGDLLRRQLTRAVPTHVVELLDRYSIRQTISKRVLKRRLIAEHLPTQARLVKRSIIERD
jgi:hypothetical protein